VLHVPVVELLAVHHEALVDRDAAAAEHVDLLRLRVVDRRLPAERVQVVLGKRLLRHRGGRSQFHPAPGILESPFRDGLADAIQISRHELQLDVLERRPAPVGQRHPSIDILGLVVARYGEHVIGVPHY
jgi:hypothetical protein